MILVLLLAMLLITAPLAVLGWILLAADSRSQKSVVKNLNIGLEAPEERRRSGSSFLLKFGRAITPAGYVKKLDKLLTLAGRPASLPLERVLVGKPVLTIVGATFALLILSVNQQTNMVVLGIFVTVLSYFVPDLLLYSKGVERQRVIQIELANTLDQMLISVGAGLGFESAMYRAATTGKGPLAEELMRTLQDMQVGRSRRDSYLAMAERTNIPELRSFVKAIVQADAYGIALSAVLRTQAKVMRVKRRQRAEEKAMQLPVKVLFPLLLFIFPVLFIVIMGPAVINGIAAFSGS